MNYGRLNRSILLVFGLSVVLAVSGGCSKKAEIVDDPTLGVVEELPAPPVAEDTTVETPVAPDYSTMAPADYGVKDVFFAFDQYELDTASMGVLSANARAIREAGTTILVSGHCDERGTLEYNLALGEKRANAVRDYLVSLGVPAAKLRVTSYGENRPFTQGSTEAAWAQNRRAHFQRP